MAAADPSNSARVRLDKWLWAARFYKTRSLSAEAISLGRVSINGQAAKPGRELRVGDLVAMRQGEWHKTMTVQALSGMRGPASVAAMLYVETPESIAMREAAAQQRRLAPEPAHTLTQGRPTKRDRRELQDWDSRWSASIGD
jgi:ribosome-associated heat shock protein Hsp15